MNKNTAKKMAKKILAEQREYEEVMWQLGKDLEKTRAVLKKTMKKLDKAHSVAGRLELSPDVEEWTTTLDYLGTIQQRLENIDETIHYALEHVKG